MARKYFSSKNRKSLSKLPNMKRTWFFYVTLPLFLFRLTYRTMECIIHNLIERGNDNGDTDERHSPVPVKTESFEVTPVSAEAAGTPVGNPCGIRVGTPIGESSEYPIK